VPLDQISQIWGVTGIYCFTDHYVRCLLATGCSFRCPSGRVMRPGVSVTARCQQLSCSVRNEAPHILTSCGWMCRSLRRTVRSICLFLRTETSTLRHFMTELSACHLNSVTFLDSEVLRPLIDAYQLNPTGSLASQLDVCKLLLKQQTNHVTLCPHARRSSPPNATPQPRPWRERICLGLIGEEHYVSLHLQSVNCKTSEQSLV